jgi:hypothetical protein
MILVLGSPDDACVRGVVADLRRQGRATLLVPEARLDAALQIRWDLPASSGYVRFAGRLVRLDEISTVFVRLRQAFQANLAAPDDASYIRAEWSALLYGWLRSLPCPVVNRPRPGAGQRLPESCAVADALAQSGFASPRVLVTASVEAARQFLNRNGGRALCTSPGMVRSVLLEHVDGLEALMSGSGTGFQPVARGPDKQAARPTGRPCRMQAVPRGRWLRVFVVGRRAFGAEAAPASLLSASGDLWRRTALPMAFARRCVRLAELLELEFVELLVVRGDGDDFVLEISDFAQVARCETALLDRITEALVRVLAGDPQRERRPQEPVAAEVTRLIHPRGRSLLTGVLPKSSAHLKVGRVTTANSRRWRRCAQFMCIS